MTNYNISEGTVTISIDEYRDLITLASKHFHLQQYGLADWDWYEDAMREYLRSDEYTMDELNAGALGIMQDENAPDYNLYVASEWLHYVLRQDEMKDAEWCAIMRDLEKQLIPLIKKEI